MKQIQKVFLSSTSRDLKDYRESVYRAVSGISTLKCVRMEDFGAVDAEKWSTADFLRHKVKDCDLLVGILGLNYGSIAEGSDESYTQVEYRAAVDNNMSRLLFLAPDTFPVQGNLIEADDLRSRQKAFRLAVGNEGERRAIYDTFNSPDDLARRVVAGITNILIESATGGLDALGECMRHPDVLKATSAWATTFRLSRSQLDVLKQYKDIHDQLHRLQFECYDVLGGAVQRFPAETSDLEVYKDTIQAIADALAEIRSNAQQLPAGDGWISEVAALPALIQSALDTANPEPLRKLMFALSRLLTLQPSLINNTLNQAAKGLALGDLVAAIRVVAKSCREHKVAEVKVGELESGADSLAQLAERLRACTTLHDKWQTIENEVRRIENVMRGDTRELRESWELLKGFETDLQSTKVGALGLRVEAVLKTEPPADEEIRKEFRAYRRCIGTSFDKVDRDLKRLCDDMRRVGESLAPIVEMMK